MKALTEWIAAQTHVNNKRVGVPFNGRGEFIASPLTLLDISMASITLTPLIVL